MKNLFMFACVCLFLQQANAQYFQRTYGNVTTIESNGQFIPCTPPTVPPFPPTGSGYVMVGRYFDPTVAGSVSELHLVHSNNNGGTPFIAPYFNRHFLLTDRFTSQVCDAWATSVDEIPNGGTFDYMVTGTIILPNPNSVNFFVLRMTANGTITWIFRYSFPGVVFKDPKIRVDQGATNVLVTGRGYDPANPANLQDVYAFSINAANGGVNWGLLYDMKPCATCGSFDDWGTDIIDNPYTAGQALIVGHSSGDGLLLIVNSANGLPLGVTRYNIPGSNSQILNCINKSGNVIGANVTPFIVGGNAMFGNQNDAWTMLIDQTGLVTWSTTHDTGQPGAPLDNTLNEIMERFNTNPFPPVYEYYTAGTIQTNAANTDIQTLKLNGGGFLVAGGEFIYGTAVDQEQGMDIHPSNTGGMAISGNTSIRAGEQLRVNAYYNGVTACNWAAFNFASVNSPPNTNTPFVNTVTNPVQDTVDTSSAPVPMFVICQAAAIAAGSNLKVAHAPEPTKEDAGFNFTVLGNGEEGVTTGTDMHITVQNGGSGTITAKIVDLLGREYACKLTDDGHGQFSISSNIPSTGTYYLVLSNGKETKSKALFIK